jgi:adenylate kinase
VSSGDLLREAVQQKTPPGVEAKKFMDSGLLVPDALVLGMVEERIGRPDCDSGFLLDGFPRTEAQAAALDELLRSVGAPLDHVVALAVDTPELLARLGGRRSCSHCDAVYHLRFNPPAVEGKCDGCGSALVVRDDDREETVRERLDVFSEQTAPLIDRYRGEGLLREVAGSGTTEEVTERILGAIGAGGGRA